MGILLLLLLLLLQALARLMSSHCHGSKPSPLCDVEGTSSVLEHVLSKGKNILHLDIMTVEYH